MKNGVCSKIKQIRQEKKFSQDYMGLRLQLSQSQYAKIENVHNELSVVRLVQLSEIFNINPTQLFEEIVYELYLTGSFQSEPFQKVIEVNNRK
ncbi:helix-turn-helix domain-containing protein [Flavobacterium sp. PLA-1-15]|uniref:helix-turn-helix domain-containing protein n=1 Tax=Flavobacterium sp. PLA-1-15 TaxID=3380533 RepID=UPI003B7F4215